MLCYVKIFENDKYLNFATILNADFVFLNVDLFYLANIRSQIILRLFFSRFRSVNVKVYE